MQPDFPMYREINGEKFYVQFPAETIELMRDMYMSDKLLDSVNVEHKVDVDGVNVVETGIVDSRRGMSGPDGIDMIDGTWWATFKIYNDEVWEAVKDGSFTGISLEGMFDLYYTLSEDKKESDKKTEKDALVSFKKSILSSDASLIDKINALKSLLH